jgi:hypothetical protein
VVWLKKYTISKNSLKLRQKLTNFEMSGKKFGMSGKFFWYIRKNFYMSGKIFLHPEKFICHLRPLPPRSPTILGEKY